MGRDLKWNDGRHRNPDQFSASDRARNSTLVVLIGGVFYLHQYGAEIPRYGVFQAEPHEMTSLQGIVGRGYESRQSCHHPARTHLSDSDPDRPRCLFRGRFPDPQGLSLC